MFGYVKPHIPDLRVKEYNFYRQTYYTHVLHTHIHTHATHTYTHYTHAHTCLVTHSCPTLPQPHGLWPTRRFCPWNSPGKSIRVGCHFLFQGIFPTQGTPTLQADFLPLSHLGSTHTHTHTHTHILLAYLKHQVWPRRGGCLPWEVEPRALSSGSLLRLKHPAPRAGRETQRVVSAAPLPG